MKSEQTKITVTAKSKILKFNEEQDPSKDEPFEVIEKTYVLEGAEAEQLLKEVGADPSEVARRATQPKKKV